MIPVDSCILSTPGSAAVTHRKLLFCFCASVVSVCCRVCCSVCHTPLSFLSCRPQYFQQSPQWAELMRLRWVSSWVLDHFVLFFRRDRTNMRTTLLFSSSGQKRVPWTRSWCSSPSRLWTLFLTTECFLSLCIGIHRVFILLIFLGEGVCAQLSSWITCGD